VSENTEIVTAFLARVEEEAAKRGARKGETAYVLMSLSTSPGWFARRNFAYKVRGVADPYYDDANIPAFIAAAVKAGVLREG